MANIHSANKRWLGNENVQREFEKHKKIVGD